MEGGGTDARVIRVPLDVGALTASTSALVGLTKKVQGKDTASEEEGASWDWAPTREGGGRWATPAREPAHQGGR